MSEPRQRRRVRLVPEAAGREACPGKPDPQRARAEAGRVGVAQAAPAGGHSAGPFRCQSEYHRELIELDPVHLPGKQQPLDIALTKRRRFRVLTYRHRSTTSRLAAGFTPGLTLPNSESVGSAAYPQVMREAVPSGNTFAIGDDE